MSVPFSPSGDLVVSDEQFASLPTGVRLCYQTFGDPGAEPLLLVMGLGAPMIWWDDELCRMIAQAGFQVIRFDNRDAGRSDRIPVPVRQRDLLRGYAGLPVRAPYSMADLTADALALLDHLDVSSAHVVGASMGGMISQSLAILAPDRVRSLTSIMSTTGNRRVGWQHPVLFPALLAPRGTTREAHIERVVRSGRLIASPAFPEPEEVSRDRAGRTWDRGVDAAGVLRQSLAIITQPDRTGPLGGLRMPVMVIHGLADRLVDVSGGRATSAAVPGSELLLIKGMGHDLPPALFPTFVSAISRTAGRNPR